MGDELILQTIRCLHKLFDCVVINNRRTTNTLKKQTNKIEVAIKFKKECLKDIIIKIK